MMMTGGSGAGAAQAAPADDHRPGVEGATIVSLPRQIFAAELVGPALLVLVGLSVVILMFGEGSPLPGLLPSEGWRRLITGFLFGTTGALMALSPVGKRSGAHINPVVTMAFRPMGKLDLRTTLGYVVAQLSGAILGALPLLAWGSMGRSVAFGATARKDFPVGTSKKKQPVTSSDGPSRSRAEVAPATAQPRSRAVWQGKVPAVVEEAQ